MRSASNKINDLARQPLGAVAYTQICRRIITLEYAPGAILDEKELMADLGLGRTPIREALLRLAGEGWIETQPNRSAVVPPITIQATRAVFEAMRVLELGVAGLAVHQQIDRQLEAMQAANIPVQEAIAAGDILAMVEANHAFHLAYARCAMNDFLFRACADARNQAKRLSFLSYASEVGVSRSLAEHYDSVVSEHEEIIRALREREEVRLKQLLLQHIATFQRRIVAYISS